MNLTQVYRELLLCPRQLATCRTANSIEELLQTLKRLWKQEQLSDDELISELSRCNQIPVEIEPDQWHGRWLPCTYHPKSRLITWCLPVGAAIEPFHDEYISRCRQQLLFNQFITPKTSLDNLLNARLCKPEPPAGFLFHLSRCGSTLVSGCLAESENACVLSESPLLTEVLLDPSLDREKKLQLLPDLISMQGSAPAKSGHIIIKWNAWDLFFWPIIYSAFPTTKTVLITRDPVEIMASHARGAGRHMAGDPALRHLGEAFTHTTKNFFEYRVGVLRALFEQAAKIAVQFPVKVIDYNDLAFDSIYEIRRYFNLPDTEATQRRMGQRMQFHSKTLDRAFRPDQNEKQHLFDQHEKQLIRKDLFPIYQELVQHSKNTEESTYHAG